MKRRFPSHRCPECHRTFFSAEAVDGHRANEQGKCFDRLPRIMARNVLTYRERNGIKPPPLPEPPEDFDVLEDF